MSLRAVQIGRVPKPITVFAFLVGRHMDGILRRVLGADVTIVCDDTSTGPEVYSGLLRKAEALGDGPIGPVALLGYSAGCQRVRKLWCDGARPAAIGLFDGTHCSWPADQWQLDAWGGMVERARDASEMLMVASHTFQLYTEGLQKDPYMSTATTLRNVTGWTLPMVSADKLYQDGLLYVQSCPSKLIDKDAHTRQQTEVMPELCRTLVAPFLRSWREALIASEEETPTTEPTMVPWKDARLTYGERMVAWSRAEMLAGVKEVPDGSNTGPRIREYLAPCVRDDRPLGLTVGAWCAASACAASRAAWMDGDYKHPYRASGSEMIADAVAAGRWHPKASGYVPQVGDLAIFKLQNPVWGRHVCRVVSFTGPAFVTIGGNEGNAWHVTPRNVTDENFLGWIRVH